MKSGFESLFEDRGFENWIWKYMLGLFVGWMDTHSFLAISIRDTKYKGVHGRGE